MGLLIRTLLIWLLVLAVPAQGAAAATMAFCGPGHHSAGTAAQMQHARLADHSHHGGAAVAEHEHPPAAASAEEDATASAASGLPAKVSDTSKHKWSVCASCCSVGAFPSFVLAVPAPVFTPTVFSAVLVSVNTFAADGPDRPPRIVLA